MADIPSATLRPDGLRVAGHLKPVRAQGDLPKLRSSAARLLPISPCLFQTLHFRTMWYVYFLQLSNDHIYLGSTNDLTRRLSSHQIGDVLSTRAYLPVVLKSYVAVETEQHARELEAYFKSGSGKAIALKRLVRRTEPAREPG